MKIQHLGNGNSLMLKRKNITANGDDGCVARHGAPVCEETRLVAAEMLGKDRFLVSG